jgi:hypothetical protein
MKKIKTIERKIEKYAKLIEKFKADKTLQSDKKKNVIFKIQMLIRELKWVLN